MDACAAWIYTGKLWSNGVGLPKTNGLYVWGQ